MIQGRSPVRIPERRKEPRPVIRSPAFRRKFEDGIPRINHKAIPLHNLYQIQTCNRKVAQEKGLQFWGCVMPQPRKFKTRKIQTSREARTIETRGETMLRKYMRRRPSLTLTPRSRLPGEAEECDVRHTTAHELYNPEKKAKSPQKHIPQSSLNQTIDSFMLTSDSQFVKLNSKSIHQMTPDELKASIMWKKKFIQIFSRQVEGAKQRERLPQNSFF